MPGRKKWSEIRRKSSAAPDCPFEHGDIVRIKKFPKGHINEFGIVQGFLSDTRVWVVNMNMPLQGTISDYFYPDELEIESSRRTD